MTTQEKVKESGMEKRQKFLEKNKEFIRTDIPKEEFNMEIGIGFDINMLIWRQPKDVNEKAKYINIFDLEKYAKSQTESLTETV